jgi:hypothetical protein
MFVFGILGFRVKWDLTRLTQELALLVRVKLSDFHHDAESLSLDAQHMLALLVFLGQDFPNNPVVCVM